MKAFKEWWKDEYRDEIILPTFARDMWFAKLGWKAALEWMKSKLKYEICPGDIEYFIDKELNDEEETI